MNRNIFTSWGFATKHNGLISRRNENDQQNRLEFHNAECVCFFLFLHKNLYFLNTECRERRNAMMKRNKKKMLMRSN